MNIALIGMSGSGKSTVAEKLAGALGYTVADSDEIIEKKHGKISAIFAVYGETYFRKLEREAVKSLAGVKNTVVATGGGCILDEENLKILKSSAKVVYLKTSVSELAKRLKGDNSRPLLSGNLVDNLAEIYKSRAEIYENSADLTVVTDGITADGVAQIILEKIK